MLSRQMSALLRAVFGWSITGLFGRLPQKQQTALSIALILSIAWPLLVVGVFLPRVAAYALAFLPLEKWIGLNVLRIIWLALAVTAPLAVGAIARWVAPPKNTKGSALRTLLAGYPLTLGFALSFLITLFVVPVLKLGAVVRRWSDEHVYVQVREGEYQNVLRLLGRSCFAAHIPVTEEPVPKSMALSTRVLHWFAKGAIAPIVADEPRMLRGKGIQVYLYPADLLLRGEPAVFARMRAAMMREPLLRHAHIVEDPAGQKIEDELLRMWALVERHRLIGHTASAAGTEIGQPTGIAASRLKEIVRELDALNLPFNQWVLLYTNLHHLERALSGGPELVDRRSPLRAPQSTLEVAMETFESRPDKSLSALVKEALEETRDLVKLEVALAKQEIKGEVSEAKHAGIGIGAALAFGLSGLTMLFVSIALAISATFLPALLLGVCLLAVAGVCGLLGYKAVPKKPLDETRQRLETDVNMMKEHLA